MVPYIDIHAHLDFPDIFPKIDEVMENAKKVDVKIILTNSVDKKTNRISLELAEKFPEVKACLGFYPPEKEIKSFEEEIEFIKENKDKIIAIGEIGMDFKIADNKEYQENVFRKQLQLAKEIGKPVIIHSRKAESDVIDVLENEEMKKVVMHCFGGKKNLIKKAADLGYYFSIPTNVVRSRQIQEIIKIVPINQLFAETDSPFLSPFKEKINEPAFVVESYKKIAEIKGLTLEETKNNIFMNWQKLF